MGGSVSGLSGTVVLQDNGGDDLSVSANGSFTFGTQLANGGAYAVTVKTNPSGQTCTVASGSGTIGSANVTNVAVTCTANGGDTTYSVGGSVSGLSGTVVLQDNGGDNLSVSANGPFTFAHPAGQRGGLRRDGAGQPVRADLHGGQRLGHDRLGQRHQRRRHLRGQRRRWSPR